MRVTIEGKALTIKIHLSIDERIEKNETKVLVGVFFTGNCFFFATHFSIAFSYR